jgi:hypothetical protein
MNDLLNERRIGLHEAAKLAPSYREGKPTHVSTILRWITKGVRLSNGELVRLEGVRLGGRWITSFEAFARFSERLTAGAIGDAPEPRQRLIPTAQQRRQRQRQLERVDRELEKAGI